MKGRVPRQIRLADYGDGYVGEAPLTPAEWGASLTFRLLDAQGREIPIERVVPLRNGR